MGRMVGAAPGNPEKEAAPEMRPRPSEQEPGGGDRPGGRDTLGHL